MAVIAEDEQVRAIWHEGSSDWLLLSFAGMEERPHGDWFWARTVAERLGLNAIGLVAQAPNWYPRAALAALAPRLAPLLARFPRRLAYGYSMGAHAALRSAALFGASHVLAFGPQYALDPAVTGAANPWHIHHNPALHAALAPTAADLPPGCFAAVVADPFAPTEALHLRLLRAALPGLRVLALPCLGHGGFGHFTGTALAARLFAATLARDPAALARLLAEVRRGPALRHSRARVEGLAEALFARGRQRRLGWALGQLAALPEAQGAALDDLRCEAALAAGQPAQALAYAEAWLARHPQHDRTLHLAANACLQLGLRHRALGHATLGYLRQPEHPAARAMLADALHQLGQPEAALRLMP